MPKSNPATADIPKLYKREAIHLLLYGFMTGVQWSLPSTNKKEAATAFIRKYGLTDTYSVEHVLITYDRINRDLIDAQRQEHKEEASS